jgi:hypothetical protein
VIPAELIAKFVARLRRWSIKNLACSTVCSPTLSLYVDGCKQAFHNDSANGRWAYVWSLTDPSARFVGGSTIVMRPRTYWGTSYAEYPMARDGVYEAVSPLNNRLIVFDDRLLHGVEPVEGNMDPLDGRVVVHGHLSEGPPAVIGGLRGNRDGVVGVIAALQERLRSVSEAAGGVGIRIDVNARGRVETTEVLTDRLNPGDAVDAGTVAHSYCADIQFPAAERSSTVYAWLCVGGPAADTAD